MSPKRQKVNGESFDPSKKIYKVAVISDLHFGSKWANTKFLDRFVKYCKAEGINTLLNCGDTVDGTMNWEQHYQERFLHSAYAYEDYTAEHYPTGFVKSYFIEGNHDLSLEKYEDEGYSFGAELVKIRKDLTFLPVADKMCAQITLKGGLSVQLYHGVKTCSDLFGRRRDLKLKSKILEMMADGSTADLYCMGHCHRVHKMIFMNKLVLGVGCFQNTTPYLKSRGIANDVCGLILRYQKKYDGHFLIIPEFKYEGFN